MSTETTDRTQLRSALPDVSRFNYLLVDLEQKLRSVIRTRREADESYQNVLFYGNQSLEVTRKKLVEEFEEAREARELEYIRREKNVSLSNRDWEQRIETAYRNMRNKYREEERAAIEEHEAELERTKKNIAEELQKKIAESMGKPTPFTERVAELEEQSSLMLSKLGNLAVAHNVELEEPDDKNIPAYLEKAQDIKTAIPEAEAVLDETGALLRRLAFRCWPARLWGRIALFVLALFVHAGAAAGVMKLELGARNLMWVGLSFIASGVLIRVLVWISRLKLRSAARTIQLNIRTSINPLAALEKLQREREANDATLKERIDRMHAAEETMQRKCAESREEKKEVLQDLLRRYNRIKEKMDGRIERNLTRLKNRRAELEDRLQREHQDKLDRLVSETAEKKESAAEKRGESIAELENDWNSALDKFCRFSEQSLASCLEQYPDWSAEKGITVAPAAAYPVQIKVGTGEVDFTKLSGVQPEDTADALPPCPEQPVALPICLSYPYNGSLLVKADTAQRERALDFIQQVLLRIYTSFPPAKAKVTFVDPVGLGQSFSAFMRLADFDDSLVSSRIWTEGAHIEKRLTDLTEHMETVIQKYLRNEYETVEEYNAEAGMMKEAYRFLVISDFPTGFTDLGLERLASIISSGPKCGVYTIIMQDAKQKLPPQIDPDILRSSGLVLRNQGDGFAVDLKGFKPVSFTEDRLPSSGEISGILDQVGQLAQDAEKVELPFEAAVPEPDKMWTLHSDTDLTVPIGQSGADRLQYISLGKGTQQHALIGGRTGSGKSTLFHVLITTASLWYGPDDVEFYLIDFKKGVEFKRLATYNLPHARAIGIESDREFGVSVLRRVDEELTRRGELFRKMGVQNLAAYRASGAEEVFPRTLLIIDEFQEFFTEDDAVARDAALYLDRFVRQGRAFGIHVILGSQTLSGIYTLAKSTLGQMGVRVSLQCNEADSHLILGEDNTAARLLTRPGEAIYNDMSGLLEGNHPFQVVWLPENTQERYLGMIAEKAEEVKWEPKTKTVVFEGNAPAELEGNLELFRLLESPADQDSRVEEGWIGEASSIKGPTEFSFTPNAGSNMLVVGQHREAAFAVSSAAVISLAGRYSPEEISFIVLMPGGKDDLIDHFQGLAEALPHSLDIVRPGGIDEVFDRLESRWGDNPDPDEKAKPVYLITFGLHKLRVLRQDDDFMFSSDPDAARAPGERFADLLSEGPECNVHSIIWCDGLGNLNRTFSRKTMREFDLKVLFQMSASDSSELIDNVAANSLGLHGALLSVESDGTMEKFRPYSVPSPAILERISAALSSKWASAAKKKGKSKK